MERKRQRRNSPCVETRQKIKGRDDMSGTHGRMATCDHGIARGSG
jgi:hypothetical protein